MNPYIKFLRAVNPDQNIINANKTILGVNLDAVKKYLNIPVAAAPVKDDKSAKKKQKKMEAMKDILNGLRVAFNDQRKKDALTDLFANAFEQKL